MLILTSLAAGGNLFRSLAGSIVEIHLFEVRQYMESDFENTVTYG